MGDQVLESALGMGMHAIMDSYSSAHEGFQSVERILEDGPYTRPIGPSKRLQPVPPRRCRAGDSRLLQQFRDPLERADSPFSGGLDA